MLEQLKKELKKRIKNGLEDETLKRLYTKEVKILFESIIDAKDIDDIAVQVKLKLVQKLFKEYRYQEAISLLEDLLANKNLLSKEDFLKVLEKKGIALSRSGRYEEAEEIFKELMESDINSFKCRGMINLGIIYIHLNKYSGKRLLNEAYQLLIEAQKLIEPDNWENRFQILYNLAIIFFEKGRFLESLKNLETALTLTDSEQHKAMVYNEMARVFITQSRIDLAKDYLDRAERILIKRPNYNELALAWNLHIRGLWHKKKGEFTNAINCFELALSTFVEKEFFSEAAEVSYELYVLNKFLESGEAEEYLDDYQYYSRLIS
ncbi:hypothetical protein BBF96_14000 [Anoxybacter fermentans]|uniref:Uncharacterized protein n=1 Tax=Anoxybacter fermentans TaxID=1323375 RepID=A0A3S9T1H5_9FIRM|nr:tetratricopeptide repeat protein [Anoxybacter fermentans]AZR74401.1 hypothetical protein BBF96_14000 [Anoxybacter fermentans]